MNFWQRHPNIFWSVSFFLLFLGLFVFGPITKAATWTDTSTGIEFTNYWLEETATYGSKTWSITNPYASTNTYLVCWISNSSTGTVSGVTYGGSAMTSYAYYNSYGKTFILKAPLTSTNNLVITWN